ncbi:glycosyltransferase [Flavobacterium pectinovorum]|uniref:Glycosyltransferase n=2 Tax=Flavobacterium pectinovorum TaxID=29533 RepID=A0A502EUI4_9FLAO|nr:glycosyltransferase family 4 protein [Flavobacterium pectinovorum]TPG40096.1 glycosyltransferase [Flavobacterium pectinovorum]
MKKNILFFCPIPPPIGGQALISNIVYKLIKPKFLINTNVKSKYFGTIIILLKTFCILFFRKVDLVYFTCTRSKKGALKDILLLSLCKLRGVKVINHLHGNEVMDLFTGGIFSKIILWAYKQIDLTIFVTERQKELMPSVLSKMKKVVIPNCYDSVLEDVDFSLKTKKDEIQILYISFLMKSKGIFIALEAFEKIAANYENVTFHIAGEPLSDYLMSASDVKTLFDDKIHALKQDYPKRIVYHGVVTGDDKKELFLESDILLFPTFFKTESFGLVNVEAMRTGNAVITTDHNFLADIVTAREGLLVKPNDVKSVYNAIEYFLENPDLLSEIQQHNIEHAKLEFSPEQFNARIKQLFLEYLN